MNRKTVGWIVGCAVAISLPAWGQEDLLWTFECNAEGWNSTYQQWASHAYVSNDGGRGVLRLTYPGNVNDPMLMSPDGLSVSHTANRYLAFLMFASGIPQNVNLPGSLIAFDSADSVLGWSSFTWRVVNGQALVRVDLNSFANWGSSVDWFRLDLPDGDSVNSHIADFGIDYRTAIINIDWIAATDDPNYLPPDQRANAPCSPVALGNFVNWPEADAVSALEAAGFVTSVMYRQGTGAADGMVLSQEPGAGTTVGEGAGMQLVVSQSYRQYRVAEFSFQANLSPSVNNPGYDITFEATFTGPGNLTYTVPGFWDGGQTWRVRFNPVVPGSWSYTTTSSPIVAGLDGQSGTFEAAPASGSNPLYRHGGLLAVSDDGHSLTHTDGTPFYWLGDTWWNCPGNLVPFVGSSNPEIKSAFKHLVDYRSNQGFTAVQMAFQSRTCFEIVFQLDMICPEYWKQCDAYIAYANEKGLLPSVGLLWANMYETQGTLEKWESLWRYVVARYGAYGVTWFITGEYNASWDFGNVEARIPIIMALGQYIKDVDPYKRAMSIHPQFYLWDDEHEAWSEPWLDFIMLQGSHRDDLPPSTLYSDLFSTSPARPVLESECVYEGIRTWPSWEQSPLSMTRTAAYNAVQSGAFGYTYGANGLWYPTQDENDTTGTDPWGPMPPWWEAVQKPGAVQMSILRDIYESTEWWKLAPMPGKTTESEVLVKGDGATTFAVYFKDGLDAETAVSLNDLTDGVAYRGHWRNPRTGETTPLGGDLVVSGGSLALPSRASSEDWMLILRNASAPVEVPDVTGLPEDEALRLLEARGFSVTVTLTYDDTVPAGDVISQNVAGGTSSTLGAAIEFVVSLGEAPPITASATAGFIEEGMYLTLTAPEGISYEWYYEGDPVDEEPGRLTGAHERVLVFDPVLQTDAGSYTCWYSLDGRKTEFETPTYDLEVLPPGSLPLPVWLLAAVLLAGAVAALRGRVKVNRG